MPVDQDGLEGRVNHFLAIYDGVAVGRRDFREVGAGLHEEDGQPLGTAAHVVLVLSLRADGRDAQQVIAAVKDIISFDKKSISVEKFRELK